jgi:hypothetical protein
VLLSDFDGGILGRVRRDGRERTDEETFALGEEAVPKIEEREVMPMEGAGHRLVRKK